MAQAARVVTAFSSFADCRNMFLFLCCFICIFCIKNYLLYRYLTTIGDNLCLYLLLQRDAIHIPQDFLLSSPLATLYPGSTFYAYELTLQLFLSCSLYSKIPLISRGFYIFSNFLRSNISPAFTVFPVINGDKRKLFIQQFSHQHNAFFHRKRQLLPFHFQIFRWSNRRYF